ncbi:MAG: ABC transporter permease subunit, partial [Bacteroidales bacterium]
MKLKFIEDKVFRILMIISMLIVFGFLSSILITILKNGWPAMSWDMITKLPGGGFYIGKEGGVLNAIVGSLYIVGSSTVMGLIISIPIVFFINIYLKKESKLASITRLSFDVLYGIPSIVYGAFAFTIIIFFGLRTSLLGGIIVITLLIIPIFVRSIDEVARQLPKDLLDATYSLGATRFEAIKVAIRQIMPGV